MKNIALTLALLLLTSLAHAQTAAPTSAPVNTLDAFTAQCDKLKDPVACRAKLAKLKQTNPSVGTNVYPGNAAQAGAGNDMATYCNSNGPSYSAARCTSAMQSYRNVKPQGK